MWAQYSVMWEQTENISNLTFIYCYLLFRLIENESRAQDCLKCWNKKRDSALLVSAGGHWILQKVMFHKRRWVLRFAHSGSFLSSRPHKCPYATIPLLQSLPCFLKLLVALAMASRCCVQCVFREKKGANLIIRVGSTGEAWRVGNNISTSS